MVGTYADVVVADAIVRGVPGFDLAMAREALHKGNTIDNNSIQPNSTQYNLTQVDTIQYNTIQPSSITCRVTYYIYPLSCY